MILSQHVLKKIGCFYTPLNGITCYTLKYVISTVFNRFKSTNMNLEAKIIAEIFFLPNLIISSMFEMRGNNVSKIGEKRKKKYEISNCFPSHFEYIRNNPIRYKKLFPL